MDYLKISAVEVVTALKQGDMTAEAYVGALVAQIEDQAAINAFISYDEERLRAAARVADQRRRKGGDLQPLHGLPIALKDNIDTIDLPTSGGTTALRGHVPPRNAPIAQTLFDAGGILLGKTNLHELAFGITNNNGEFGPVRNPYDPSRIPGGSSGGTGAAVGARMAPAGLGSDTGGSVRVPAALCGIAGLRPTLGRYPREGIVPISSTRDTAGPMARTVADLALLDGVITGGATEARPTELKGLRLGVPRAYFYENLEPDVVTVIDDALRVLADRGVVLVEANIPEIEDINANVSFPVALYEVIRLLPEYLNAVSAGIDLEGLVTKIASPDVKAVLEGQLREEAIPEEVYRAAIEVHRPALQRAFADYFRDHNVAAVVFPTTPLTARPIGQDETVELNGEQVPTFTTFIRNCDPSSNAGLPGVSVPAGLSGSGLPVGIEFDGPANSDTGLLAIAAAFERAVGVLPPPKL